MPRKGRREINDYAHRHIRTRAGTVSPLSGNVKTQYLSHFDRTDMHTHAHARDDTCASACTQHTYPRAGTGIAVPKRYKRARQKRTAYILSLHVSRGLSKGSEEKENVYLYTDVESKNDAPLAGEPSWIFFAHQTIRLQRFVKRAKIFMSRTLNGFERSR